MKRKTHLILIGLFLSILFSYDIDRIAYLDDGKLKYAFNANIKKHSKWRIKIETASGHKLKIKCKNIIKVWDHSMNDITSSLKCKSIYDGDKYQYLNNNSNSNKPAKKDTLRVHKVRSGDNLHLIANNYNVEIEDIIENNEIDDPEKLKLNQIIKIPRTKPYPDDDYPFSISQFEKKIGYSFTGNLFSLFIVITVFLSSFLAGIYTFFALGHNEKILKTAHSGSNRLRKNLNNMD